MDYIYYDLIPGENTLPSRFIHQVIVYSEYSNILFDGSYLKSNVKEWLKNNIGSRHLKWSHNKPAREHQLKMRYKTGKTIRSVFYFTRKDHAIAFMTRWK